MECHACSFVNIDGIDQCEQCGVDLSEALDPGQLSDIEVELLRTQMGEFVQSRYLTVAPDTSMREVVSRLADEQYYCALVVEQGGIVGILTERDLLMKLAHQFEHHAEDPVSLHMTVNPVTLKPSAPVVFGLNRMMVGGYRHIPIVDEHGIQGVVSVRHILSYLTVPSAASR